VKDFDRKGHATIPDVFSAAEVASIIQAIDQAEPTLSTAPGELHAIRNVIQRISMLRRLLFHSGLLQIVHHHLSLKAFLTKSIYFDKPPGSNWFVAWHQDISISVLAKADVPGYAQWTQKSGIIGVVPPVRVLENILTVRVHLDHTDETNGALRVVEGSHLEGIVRKEAQPWDVARERVCAVPAGGVMLMRPLTMHASRRAQSGGRRRVIHLEFADCELDPLLQWGERLSL
jgi:ectoine hydroxylase-related dioxygenase (phytanoyl-CoA dioxygenase family)